MEATKNYPDFFFKNDKKTILLIPTSPEAKEFIKNCKELKTYDQIMPKIEREYFRYIFDDIRMKGLTIKGFK